MRAAFQHTLNAKFLALAEVGLAFGAMHVGFRVVKRFTAWGHWENALGYNFSPGAVMIGVVLLVVGLKYLRGARRSIDHRSFSDCLTENGVVFRLPAKSAYPAFVCLIALVLIGAVLLTLGIPIARIEVPWMTTCIVAGATSLATIITLWALSRNLSTRWEMRISGSYLLALVVLLALAPIVGALWQGRSFDGELLTVLWLLLGAGLGEELFFRGYVQTRLNRVFGRRLSLFGVSFGPGLFLASMFFGLVHLLNPFHYFEGRGSLDWAHGLTTMSALHYGFLRERTDSLVAPVIVHFLVNLGPRLPLLLEGGYSSG